VEAGERKGGERRGGKGSGHPQIFTWIVAYAVCETRNLGSQLHRIRKTTENFADDAKLFKCVICDENHKALHLGLNALQDWSNKWLLKLNILKRKTVFFGRNINKNYT